MSGITQKQWQILKVFASNSPANTTPEMIEVALGKISPLTEDIAYLDAKGLVVATLLRCEYKFGKVPSKGRLEFCGGRITQLGLGFYRAQMQVIDGVYN